MAIHPANKYPGKIAPPNADYPYGSARNITTANDGTGTPLEKDWVNDLFGIEQSLLYDLGVVPNGTPESLSNAQILTAIKRTKELQFITEARLKAGDYHGEIRYLIGRTSIRDGGEGLFIWDSVSTDVDDGGTIYQPSGTVNGRWVRLLSDGEYNPLWFSATFSDFVTAIGSTPVSVVITADTAVPGTIVLPATMDIKDFRNGAQFTGAGSLTINRMSANPGHQVFASTLTVRMAGFQSVKVRWFGSNAAALQAAINAPIPSGHYDNGDIYSFAVDFGDEIVNIGNDDVTLNRNCVTLRGASRLFSEIRMANGSLVIPSSVFNITIEGLLLYNTNNVDGITIDIQGVAPNGPRRITIKENEFRGGKYKIRSGHAYSSKILDNYFYSSVAYDTYGIYIDDSVTQSITIRGNQFQDSRVYVDGYYGINMEENYFEGSVGPLVDIVRCVGYTHHGNRYECDAAGILGLNIRQECAGGSVKGNTFHGSGNASACVVCDGAQHEFGGNYFLRASGGVDPVSLLVNSRFNKFGANYYTATGQQPPISDAGYRNTAYKQGVKTLMKYAQDCVTGGDAIKKYENDDRVYIELPDGGESFISALFPLPVDMSDGLDGKYTVTIKVHYSAGSAPGQTLTFAFGYKLLGVGEYPFNSQSEFSGAVLSSLSNLLQIASYEITQLFPVYWDDIQVKGLGALVRPTVKNGLWYVATGAGTTGATEPVWPTSVGGTVVDGTVTWTAQNPLDDFLRVRIRRNPADANDTFTQAVKIVAIELEYSSIDFFPTGRN